MTAILCIISYIWIALLLFYFWVRTGRTSILSISNRTEADDLAFEATFWPVFVTIRLLAFLFRLVEKRAKNKKEVKR